ncbi:YciI family protein [Sinomicrobium weinanense]|uniref:YCII-related domain-containing protein n=1 Tax=Sinomicrobium weinanense TaxID=2842200 RepID=A0A926JUZ4_9FLAO|nr:YciI family protein [Sinomicrobium weinanense]MBC9798060.1 hypothetical protein [Sinomicrobium weinanense]MBU3122527.1 hypothetical protein [Sinomicrobium weinanense]
MTEFILIFRRDIEEFTQDYKESLATAVPGIGKKWFSWMGKLHEEGRMVGTYQRISKAGRTVMPDSTVQEKPYTEIKDAFSGFLIIRAHDFDEALSIAKDCPNLLQNGSVEVRKFIDHNDQVS